MLWIGIAVLSGEVIENGREIDVASIPHIKRFLHLAWEDT